MKRLMVLIGVCAVCVGLCRAEDPQLQQAKMGLLVQQAEELYQESCRKGSPSHGVQYQYFFGLIYSCGTNITARKDSPTKTQLTNRYMMLVDNVYKAYTKVEQAEAMADATGATKGKAGTRHRAKRRANVEKLRDEELGKSIKQWESFVGLLKRTR